MIYRIDVRSRSEGVNRGAEAAPDAIGTQIREMGIDAGPVTSERVFLIDSKMDAVSVLRVASELLADPVTEEAHLTQQVGRDPGRSRIEVHLKPGVMDPVAESTEMAIRDMGLAVREVRTGRAYILDRVLPTEVLQRIAARVLANGVIESVHFEQFLPVQFQAGSQHEFRLRHVALRGLSDGELSTLSRTGHLFLSLAEMKAVQRYFEDKGREPTDIELETLAQTWSEHCVHKTLKSAVEVEVRDPDGKVVGSRRYKNLIKETIFDSTMQLMAREKEGDAFCLSVFVDNAGVIAFDDVDAVCFKVETHNHPSAIEPYGGSATGIGGVIRDILGTGLGAKPVANSDVFCVAMPDAGALPKGIIHPKRVLQQIVAGVRDYGNRMGIPTVNGAVYFDDRYLGNPLVFCGCVGLIPRDKIFKESGRGDAIVVMGGRTGRDGIHGATFSSAELTDTHADEFSHAVQIGNAITEKKVSDVILQARDRGLFSAVTDCGAGGLSSAIGEMGEKIGALVKLDTVPLKYAGLRYDEIWISEAQERMVLAVPPGKVKDLLALASSEDVEATVIGEFGTDGAELILQYHGQEVGRIAMDFMHRGIPMPTRKAVVVDTPTRAPMDSDKRPIRDRLLSLLAHPNIASKHWIIRQYDHEVQGGSVIKPLVGPMQMGPSDAAVIRPKLHSRKGVAIGCGMAPRILDPYQMAIASIDEAIRNVVAVGADPAKTAILDNFCWPSVDDEVTMGTLVRACEACRDAALAYGIPFISGKDSLHNQFTKENGEVIRIPNTLLISAISVIEDVRKCITMDFKRVESIVCHIGGSDAPKLHRQMARAIASGLVLSCHDVSDGGLAVAVAEMAIASEIGVKLTAQQVALFDEDAGGYVVEIGGESQLRELTALMDVRNVATLGHTTAEAVLVIEDKSGETRVPVAEMRRAWRGTLDW